MLRKHQESLIAGNSVIVLRRAGGARHWQAVTPPMYHRPLGACTTSTLSLPDRNVTACALCSVTTQPWVDSHCGCVPGTHRRACRGVLK
jgi:hypothetical protein